jgi:hypothetical protein
MESFGPLDSVITGYAYENATTALGVLEANRKDKGWISTEMLCTLDNFIRVVLFSDRIFVHEAHTELKMLADRLHVTVSKGPFFGASAKTKSRFDAEGIFHSLPLVGADDTPDKTLARAERTLKAVKADTHALCTLQASWPDESLVVWQEMHFNDIAFIEAIINQCGLGRFKAVFPGEHLYLGLRGGANFSQSIADLAARRLRAVVRGKLKTLNEKHEALGALPLPELPPLFLLRLLRDSPDSSQLTDTLFSVRLSAPFLKFRQCVAQCHKMLESNDVAAHEKAEKVIGLFRNFTFEPEEGVGKLLKHMFKVGKAAVSASAGDIKEPAEEIFELSTMLFKLIGRHPLLALEEFGAKKADPKKLDAYLQQKFGDKFNLGEMHSVATFLAFPETAPDWSAEQIKFDVLPSRADSSAPINARAVQFQTRIRSQTSAAERSSDELLQKAVPFELINELIKSGIPQEKIEELLGKDDPIRELEVLRKKTQAGSGS